MRELDIDLIDRIKPLRRSPIAILSKADEPGEVGSRSKRSSPPKRATLSLVGRGSPRFGQARPDLQEGRRAACRSYHGARSWEKRMAEGIAFLQRKVREREKWLRRSQTMT